jgi:hypothetical protein
MFHPHTHTNVYERRDTLVKPVRTFFKFSKIYKTYVLSEDNFGLFFQLCVAELFMKVPLIPAMVSGQSF